MHIEQKVNIHNRFDVEVRDAKTGELKQKATGFNIVLDQMWTRLCGGSSYFVNIHFGTGGGTLSPSRTSLFTHLGTKTAADEEQVKALPVSRWKRKIVLNPEEFVGSTITEVGIAFGSTASNLVTHAMLKDSEGNPISITKTDLDVVTIYATVFVTINNATGITMLGMPASNQLINYLVGGASAPTGSFFFTEALSNGNSIGNSASASWTSDTVNKKRKTNTIRFDINTGNGNVKTFGFANLYEVLLPLANVFEGMPYSDVPVGVGDSILKHFLMPSRNIRSASLVSKINGSISSHNQRLVRGVPLAKIKNLPNIPDELVQSISISKDGSRLAIKNNQNPYTHVWNLNTNLKETLTVSGITYGGNVDFNDDGSVLAICATSYTPYHAVYRRTNGIWTLDSIPVGIATITSFLNAAGDKLYEITNASPYLRVHEYSNGVWVRNTNLEITLPSNLVKFAKNKNAFVAKQSISPFFKVFDLVDALPVARPDPLVGTPPSAINALFINADGSVIGCTVGATVYVFIWDGSSWFNMPTFTVSAFSPTSLLVFDNGDQVAVFNESGASNNAKMYLYRNGSYILQGDLLPETLPYVSMYAAIEYNELKKIIATCKNAAGDKLLLYEIDKDLIELEFSSSPNTGLPVTADYIVDGVHKTNQFIIDVSFAIAFGEGA